MTPNPLGSGPLAKAKQEEKKGAGLPSFAFKSPSTPATGSSFLNARGGAPSGSLLERLRSLKTSELAFILAGVGALVLAPLAEHMISSSEGGTGNLEAGFDSRGNPFSDNLPYEDGVSGMAAGGLLGDSGGRRVVTPLKAPDPLHMIVGSEGSGASQPRPRTPGDGPARKPAPRKKSNWKNALSNAAKSGVSKAAGSARLPKPNPKLAGTLKGLAALSSAGGSTSASLPAPKLEAPSSKGLTGSQKVASSLSRMTASPDFRGEASRGIATGGAERAAGAFDGRIRTGSGNSEFLTPTSQASAGGAAAGGRGQGEGGEEKAPGVSSAQNQREMGESLASQRAKMEMQKALDLKYAKRQYEELDKRKMLDQVRAQTESQLMLKGVDIAGQLANTALQATLNPNQNQQQGQGQGAGNPGVGAPSGNLGSRPAGEGGGSIGSGSTALANEIARQQGKLGGTPDPDGQKIVTAAREVETQEATTSKTGDQAGEAVSNAEEAAKQASDMKEALDPEIKTLEAVKDDPNTPLDEEAEAKRKAEELKNQVNESIQQAKQKEKAAKDTLKKFHDAVKKQKEKVGTFEGLRGTRIENDGNSTLPAIADATSAQFGESLGNQMSQYEEFTDRSKELKIPPPYE